MSNPITAKKKKNAEGGVFSAKLAAMSARERFLVVALLLIAVISAGIYFLVVPGLENLDAAQEEVITLQEQKSTEDMVIAGAESARADYTASSGQYTALQKQFYPTLGPDALDRLITNLLIGAGFQTSSLSIQQGSGEDAEGTAGGAASYTVTVKASGTLAALNQLLVNVEAKDGVYLTGMDYTRVKSTDENMNVSFTFLVQSYAGGTAAA